ESEAIGEALGSILNQGSENPARVDLLKAGNLLAIRRDQRRAFGAGIEGDDAEAALGLVQAKPLKRVTQAPIRDLGGDFGRHDRCPAIFAGNADGHRLSPPDPEAQARPGRGSKARPAGSWPR